MIHGGYGNAAYGRHQNGLPGSDLEPRFRMSIPYDDEIDVSVERWIEFEMYCYSSTLLTDHPDALLEISENSGATFQDATQLPYSCTIRPIDGQRIWFKIRKNAPWPYSTTVIIRVTYKDEFGQDATKTAPVEWP